MRRTLTALLAAGLLFSVPAAADAAKPQSGTTIAVSLGVDADGDATLSRGDTVHLVAYWPASLPVGSRWGDLQMTCYQGTTIVGVGYGRFTDADPIVRDYVIDTGAWPLATGATCTAFIYYMAPPNGKLKTTGQTAFEVAP